MGNNFGSGDGGAGGAGGAGVSGQSLVIINSGVITGGSGGAGGVGGAGPLGSGLNGISGAGGNAITFTGGTNVLELRAGSVLTGNVVAFSAADALKLGGSTNAAFDVSLLGAQYQGFGVFEKNGTSIWTLTNATAALTPWTVSGGMLAISQDASLGNAAGGVTLAGGALRYDVAMSSARNVTLNAGGGTLDSNGNAVTLSGMISGTGVLTKAGAGTLTLTGANNYSGGTTVSAGTLVAGVANAFGTGSLNIATGATADFSAFGHTAGAGTTLSGTGTAIGAATIGSGGIFAPGNSIGTMTVNGNLTFAPGSIFRVETDAAGNADRVNVVGAPGTITINGGTVDVQAGAGSYARNTRYTILTSTGATTGQFSAVTSNLAFLTPTLIYQPNAVLLDLASSQTTGYASVATTGNQAHVANYLTGIAGGPGSAAGLLQQLDNLSAPQARTAFDGLSGSSHASASQIGGAIGRMVSGSVMARADAGGTGQGSRAEFRGLQYARLDIESTVMPVRTMTDMPTQLAQVGGAVTRAAAGEAGFWGQAIGTGGSIDSDGNGPGSSYRAGGFMAGYDVMLNSQWLLGGSFGYLPTDWDSDVSGASRSRGRIETPLASLYARYASGPWQLRLNGGFADHKFKTARDVTIGAATTTVSSTHRGQEWSAAAELEYAVPMGRWELRPLAALRYANLREDGFTESGTNALSVDARNTSNANAAIGARALVPFADGGGGWEFRAALSQLFGDVNSPVSARLAGQPAGFTADGTPLKRTALNLSGGVAGKMTKNVSGFAEAAYETRGSGQDAYAVTAGLRVLW